MLIFRFLLFSLVTSFGIVAVRADAVAPQTDEKPKPAATAEPGITFDWVHVDGPYVAMTFDDGPSAKLTPKLLDLLAAHHIKATSKTLPKNPISWRGRYAKDMRLRTTAGRIPTSLRCRTTEFVISCTKRRTRFEAQVAIVSLYCVHLMVRSQPGKKNGSTRSLVTKLCFGTSIHWTGEGPDRVSFAIGSSKWRAPARLFWRTTFIPARSRRCRAC